MNAVLRHPAFKIAPQFAISALFLLGAGLAALTLRPFPDPGALPLPFLAIGCGILATWIKIDSGAWKLEAPFLALTLALLGPWWTLFAAAGIWVSSAFIRTGKAARGFDPIDVGTFAFACGGAISSSQFLSGSAASTAFVFAFAWKGAHFLLDRSRFMSLLKVVAPAFVAMALGGLVDAGNLSAVWIGLVPIGLMASIAVFERRSGHAHQETLQALALMLQRAHPYTHAHIERVASIAERTALKLGLSADRARMIHEAARLHDIGKIAVDELILDKPGALTAEEYEHVKLHSAFGAAILDEIEEMQAMADWIRYHHERPDGLGYPKGLSGEEIPMEARIIAVADAFDAMTGGFESGEKRPYREPISPSEALEEMDRCAGTQFDRAVVDAFRHALNEEVRL